MVFVPLALSSIVQKKQGKDVQGGTKGTKFTDATLVLEKEKIGH